MVDDIGPLRPIEADDLPQCAHRPEQAVAASPPAERVQGKPFGADPLAMRLDPGGNGDVAARLAQGPGKGQPVGPEIPILSGQEEQLRPLLGALHR